MLEVNAHHQNPLINTVPAQVNMPEIHRSQVSKKQELEFSANPQETVPWLKQ